MQQPEQRGNDDCGADRGQRVHRECCVTRHPIERALPTRDKPVVGRLVPVADRVGEQMDQREPDRQHDHDQREIAHGNNERPTPEICPHVCGFPDCQIGYT
jgi:hypothetical protein